MYATVVTGLEVITQSDLAVSEGDLKPNLCHVEMLQNIIPCIGVPFHFQKLQQREGLTTAALSIPTPNKKQERWNNPPTADILFLYSCKAMHVTQGSLRKRCNVSHQMNTCHLQTIVPGIIYSPERKERSEDAASFFSKMQLVTRLF